MWSATGPPERSVQPMSSVRLPASASRNGRPNPKITTGRSPPGKRKAIRRSSRIEGRLRPAPMHFTELIDLAAERLGGAVLGASDEFFAPKENLLKHERPVWRDGEFTDRGKWMDGWETRRRRTPGHDWAIVRLGQPGIIQGVVVDTSHFK